MHYVFGEYILDTTRQDLRCRDVPVPLEPKVYQMLLYLVQHRDRLLSKDELLAHVWADTHIHDNAVARCVAALRQALGDSPQRQQMILTRRGQGYRFVAAVTERDDALAPAPAVSLEPSALPLPTPPSAPPAPLAAEIPVTSPSSQSPPSERKLITVLCGVLTWAPQTRERLGLDGLYEVEQALEALVQRVVAPYAGTVYQVSSAQSTVLFGAPVAQEDHAQRALLTALALQQHWPTLAEAAGIEPAAAPTLALGLHSGSVAWQPKGLATPSYSPSYALDVPGYSLGQNIQTQ